MKLADKLLPPRVRAELAVKETLLDVCRLKARHRDADVAFAYAREAVLIKNEIDAIRKDATVHVDKPEASAAAGGQK